MELNKEVLQQLEKMCHEDTFGNRSYGLPTSKNNLITKVGFHSSMIKTLIDSFWVPKPKIQTYELAILNNKKLFSKKPRIPEIPTKNVYAYIINQFYYDYQNLDQHNHSPSRVSSDGRWVYHASVYSVNINEKGSLEIKFESFPMNLKEKYLKKIDYKNK